MSDVYGEDIFEQIPDGSRISLDENEGGFDEEYGEQVDPEEEEYEDDDEDDDENVYEEDEPEEDEDDPEVEEG